MIKINEKNINTNKYWDKRYNKGLDPNIVKMDTFKFENIAHHIIDGRFVVDLGCGTGELCDVIKKLRPNCAVHGVDYSVEAIKQAKKKNPSNIYEVSDIATTGFEANQFDYVVSTETIEHLEKPEELLREASRLLRINGVFMLTTPFKDHIPSSEHVWEFNFSDIEYILMKWFKKYWVFPWAAGWTEVREERTGRLVFPKGHWDTIFAIAIK